MISLLLALSSANAASVTLKVANPVAVDLPNDVHFLGVAHRNLPADPEKHPAIAAEAEHSSEVPGGDLEAADTAVHEAFLLLADSGRFDVVEIGGMEERDRTGVFGDVLPPGEVVALCGKHEVEALLVLEGLDTSVDEKGKDTVITGQDVFEARQLIEGRALWRTYLCDGTMVDEDLIETGQLRFEDRSSDVDPEKAWENLPEPSVNMKRIGPTAGKLEARRLAPSWATVKRTWMPGGSPELKEAGAAIKADDWVKGIQIWGDVFDSSEAKVKGKAALNLAVAAERSGDMGLAREWLALAAEHWGGGAVTDYQAVLERRWAANEKVTRMDSTSMSERPETPDAEAALAIPAEKAASGE